MDIVIVGAVAGGSVVAAQIKRAIPEANVTLVGADAEIGYGTCGMPFVIGGLIEDKEKIKGPSAESFKEKRQIDTFTRHEVLSINRQDKTVDIHDLENGKTFKKRYDKLILSPGGRSRLPDLKGLGDLPLLTLKNYAEMEQIIQYIEQEKPESCAIIGGGFIGVELAENFVRLGIRTAVIERNDRVMKVMDPEVTDILGEEMKKNGITLYFDDAIEQVDGNTLHMKKGLDFKVDFLVASIGLIPNTELAEEAGLAIGKTGGIITNSYMQTDDPDIYAIGDAAEGSDWFTGKPKRVQLAWHAHREAAIVTNHLAGKVEKINGYLGTMITKLFSLTAAMTGHSAKELTEEGIPFETVEYNGRTNAIYYPVHGNILLRVHYDSTSRKILGAQAVGDLGVDKRIDVIATAIMGQLTVDDLAALELCYSPPYSSPKDPVNMIGYKAK